MSSVFHALSTERADSFKVSNPQGVQRSSNRCLECVLSPHVEAMLDDERAIEPFVPLSDVRVFAGQAPSIDFAHGRRRIAENGLIRDVHP